MYSTFTINILAIMFVLASFGKASAQMVSFGFDAGVISAEKNEILLEVTPLRITSGSVSTGSVSTSNLPNPPYAQSTIWTATERGSAKYFFFEMNVPDGFQIEIDRVSLLAEVTVTGPSAVGLSVGAVHLPEEDISDQQILSADYDLSSEGIVAGSVRVEIRAWRNGSRETTGNGTFRVDDIMVYGRVTSTSDGSQVPYVLRPTLSSVSTGSAVISSVIGFEGGETISSAGIILAPLDFDGEFLVDETGVITLSSAPVAQRYSQTVTGLAENTRYKVRSFAVNSVGTGYSDTFIFATRKGFDGAGYYNSFRGESFQAAVTPEWTLSDTTLVGTFGSGAAGGLRWSNGVVGYLVTGTKSSFDVSVALQNTTGVVLDELMIAYHGRSAVSVGFRYPGWTVEVNGSQVPALAFSTVDSLGRFGIQYHLTDLAIAADSVFQVRWQTTTVSSGSGGHRQIGISDVVVALPSAVEITYTGDAGWRMLAPPVWYMHSDLANELSPLQGFGSDGAARNLYNGYSGVEWLPSAADEAAVRPERLLSGGGYLLYVFDNEQFGSRRIGDGRMLRIDGIVPFFDVEVPVHSQGNRWNLLGNPYSQGFDIRELQADGDIVPVVQIWQDAQGVANAGDQSAGTWVLSNSSAVNHIIAAGQGFMLQNGNTSRASMVTFPVSGRADGGALLKDYQPPEPRIEFQLSTRESGQRRVLDKASQIVFLDKTGDDLEQYQVEKLPSLSGSPQVSVISTARLDTLGGEMRLAQLALPQDFGSYIEVWLDISGGKEGQRYELSWGMMLDVPHFLDLILTDVADGSEVNLRYEPEFSFIYEDATRGEGIQSGRFKLEIVNAYATGLENTDLPLVTTLYPNYPNPFNPTTAIRFDLAQGSHTRLELFDILGRHVDTPVDGFLPAGSHAVNINAGSWASGVYLYRLSTANMRFTRKMTLIR
jgi:hypothetical protein